MLNNQEERGGIIERLNVVSGIHKFCVGGLSLEESRGLGASQNAMTKCIKTVGMPHRTDAPENGATPQRV